MERSGAFRSCFSVLGPSMQILNSRMRKQGCWASSRRHGGARCRIERRIFSWAVGHCWNSPNFEGVAYELTDWKKSREEESREEDRWELKWKLAVNALIITWWNFGEQRWIALCAHKALCHIQNVSVNLVWYACIKSDYASANILSNLKYSQSYTTNGFTFLFVDMRFNICNATVGDIDFAFNFTSTLTSVHICNLAYIFACIFVSLVLPLFPPLSLPRSRLYLISIFHLRFHLYLRPQPQDKCKQRNNRLHNTTSLTDISLHNAEVQEPKSCFSWYGLGFLAVRPHTLSLNSTKPTKLPLWAFFS